MVSLTYRRQIGSNSEDNEVNVYDLNASFDPDFCFFALTWQASSLFATSLLGQPRTRCGPLVLDRRR